MSKGQERDPHQARQESTAQQEDKEKAAGILDEIMAIPDEKIVAFEQNARNHKLILERRISAFPYATPEFRDKILRIAYFILHNLEDGMFFWARASALGVIDINTLTSAGNLYLNIAMIESGNQTLPSLTKVRVAAELTKEIHSEESLKLFSFLTGRANESLITDLREFLKPKLEYSDEPAAPNFRTYIVSNIDEIIVALIQEHFPELADIQEEILRLAPGQISRIRTRGSNTPPVPSP